MKRWSAFWNILAKDMRTYYLKPPNLSWGLIFPLAWAGMFFVRTGAGMESVKDILPGVMAVSVLFGTTSMLAVAVTFEKRGRSFDRLLLAPVPFVLLMAAKISGAILLSSTNAFVPLAIAAFLTDLSMIAWGALVPVVILIAISSTLLALLIAVSVTEVFEAQTLSNFFRFPMLFLCGLFVPVSSLPVWLKPLSFLLPLTYGADALHGSINRSWSLPAALDFGLLAAFCAGLFGLCLLLIRRRWIS